MLYPFVVQKEELQRAGLPAGGVLTPASGLGPVLLERLRKADLVFCVRGSVEPRTPAEE